MATSRIEVTSAQLRAKANALEQLNNQYKTTVGQLGEKEAQLNTKWDGDANDAFHQMFLINKNCLDNFAKVIDQYIAALRAAADEYDRAEAQAAGMATTV